MRVRGALELMPQDDLAAGRRGHGRAGQAQDAFFQTNAAKFFADGVIEGHTGYLKGRTPTRSPSRAIAATAAAGLAAHRSTAFAAATRPACRSTSTAIGDAARSESLDAIAYAEA